MRDYKFNTALDKRSSRRAWLISGLLLAAAAGAVGWLLLDKAPDTPSPATVDQGSPGTANNAASKDQSASEKPPELLSKPLALPPQSKATPAKGSNQKAPLADAHSALDTPASGPMTLADQPADASSSTPDTSAAQPDLTWHAYKIASGDTLSAVFKHRGLSAELLYKIIHNDKKAAQLADIRPDQTLRFQTDENGTLQQLVWVKSPIDSLHITRTDDGFQSEWVNKNVDIKIVAASGTVQSSLSAAAKRAGLTYAQVLRMAQLFRTDINFSTDVRPGDQFRVLYEKRYLNGKELKDGPIVAAEFTNLGTTYTAFRYEDDSGDIGYYNEKGISKRRAFMRAPLKYVRISSRFSKHRWDPYLKRWAPHKGVDFAAPTGTPIKASANGRIVFRGQQRGYGNVVMLKNGRKYETLYAHMSRFAAHQHVGERVDRGEVIGYVGMTGWATGPHLHYEVRINGVARNPLTVKLPMAPPVPRQELARFKAQISPLIADLAKASPGTMVATNNTTAQ